MRARTPVSLGASIRARRTALGLTQQEVAESAGVGRDWLSRLENGHPTARLHLVLDVLQVLGLEVALLDQVANGDDDGWSLDEHLRDYDQRALDA